MTPCPPAEQLLGFVSGNLPDEAYASVETHIDECAACRTSLSGLAKRDVASSEFGRYKLETVLGSGGMGIVYRAWDPQLARPLAIKVVKQAAADEANKARLVREAQSLARLSHSHVCHVYDVGTEGDEVWVAMELIDGVTLRAWAGTHDRDELLGVLLDAADGIAAAHEAGIVHRDIKPENVLVTRDNRAIVTDFGLARVETPIDPVGSTATSDPYQTRSGAVVGTPAYLAPEQLTGAPLDARVDQFAWAVMAWELLTGMRPFPIIAGARLDAIRAGLTPPASLARPIAEALSRALQIAPRDRFASMRELIAAIRAADRPRARATRMPVMIATAAVLVAGGAVAAVMLAGSTSPPPLATADAPLATGTAPATPPATPPPPPTTASAAPAEPAPIRAAPPTAPTAPGRSASAAPPRPSIAATAKPPPSTTRGAGGGVHILARPFSRARAISSIDYFCRIPVDAAHPDPKLAKPILDWGKVTKKETVIAMLGDREEQLSLYEVVGQRGTYHFDGDEWNDTIGQFEAPIGGLVVLCQDGTSEMFKLPGAWRGPLGAMRAMLPVSAPPRTGELAKLDPLHIFDITLMRDGGDGKISLDPARRYLVHAKVIAADGARWEMEQWWLDVPTGVRGAGLVAAGKRLWFVIEAPVLEDQPEGNKPRLVLHAAAVLDELFPE